MLGSVYVLQDRVYAISVQELLLFLVLNRVSRNLSSFLLRSLIVSCHILVVFALVVFFVYVGVCFGFFFLFIMVVCS